MGWGKDSSIELCKERRNDASNSNVNEIYKMSDMQYNISPPGTCHLASCPLELRTLFPASNSLIYWAGRYDIKYPFGWFCSTILAVALPIVKINPILDEHRMLVKQQYYLYNVHLDREAQDFISSTVMYSFFYFFPCLIEAKVCLFSRSDILMDVRPIVSSFKKVLKLIIS